ncbi:MAG TPA: serine/threonine-protein kinase, partial [Labilithrix sp.]|nr:serine/threonine-protein kinase [Labilithrix sp.]
MASLAAVAHAAFAESLRAGRIGGRYLVDRVLGQGGMGLVVSARYPDLDQLVAIKILLPELAQNAVLSARFLREAKLAARFESPHLVRVFDVGRLDNGAPYMVMELLSGTDLGKALAERGRLPVTEAVDILLQAIAGIAHLHASGVVHRDLKPSNVFLARGRGGTMTVKILDFGVSKEQSDGVTPGLTATDCTLGTPQYMSPEQVKDSKRVDLRSDIWSLGVILYEILAGGLPFSPDGDSAGAQFGAILYT